MSRKRQNKVGVLLAGDVGGTKTSLALFDLDQDVRHPFLSGTFINDQFINFGAVLKEFLAENNKAINALSLGIAGPVVKNEVQMQNSPWKISSEQLSILFDTKLVWLLNDLQASAESIEFLRNDEFVTLNEGEALENGTIAIVSPGTGLGEAYASTINGKRVVFATEGGHSGFSPRNTLQDDLHKFLRKEYGRVSIERVCSGKGIPDIYNFLRDSGYAKESEHFSKTLSNSPDPAAAIFDAATDENQDSKLCKKTLEIFLELLGAEAGDFALKTGARGGVFIGGGIIPRILKSANMGILLKAFYDKGRYREYMQMIPVKVILNSESPLIGAAAFGFREFWKDYSN